jgi:hypothetical protein
MSVIKNFVAKLLFKKKGAIANNKAVEFSAKDIEQRLMKFNIDPNTIKSEGELKQLLNLVQKAEDQAFTDRFGSMLQGSRFGKQGEVVDMTGKKIDPNKGIMGGTQTTEETIKENLMKTDNPFSELVRATEKGPKTLKEREAEILERMNRENKEAAQRIRDRKKQRESLEDFVDDAGGVNPDDPRGIDDFIPDPEDMAQGGRAGFADGSPIDPMDPTNKLNEVLNAFRKLSKRSQNKIGFRNFFESYAEENFATGGRAGFANGSEGLMSLADKQKESLDPGAPSIVLNPEERKMEKVFETDKVEEAIKEIIKRSIGPLDMAEIPISEKGNLRFGFDSSGSRQLTGGLDLLGGELNIGMGSGRQGKGMGFEFRKRFEKGGMSRRQFMKIMGGIASLPFIGKFFKGAKPAAKVADVVTKSTGGQPPTYFFDLAEKIKVLGRESKISPRERVREINYKNYELQEDLTTGDITIKKTREAMIPGGDEAGVVDESYMILRKGQADEMTKGKIPADEYEELTIRPDIDGKMKEVDDGLSNSTKQSIMEEVGQGGGNLDQRTLEEIARGKLASGGVAMMLGE